MSRSVSLRLLVVVLGISAFFTGCTRDPNVRKQKFLESGNRYAKQGKLREAEIQYPNALQIDPRFAEAFRNLQQAVSLQSQGLAPVSRFTVSPSSVNLGSVPVGRQDTVTFTIANSGNQPATAVGSSGPGGLATPRWWS